MIQDLESVALTADLPEYGLERGDIGTSLLASQVRPIARGEIAHVRTVQRVPHRRNVVDQPWAETIQWRHGLWVGRTPDN
jgi:hypothetical protein